MPKLIIKKYPNRRLYDTARRCYITLDDIKKLVIAQTDFRIVDARTKKDLTQITLMQIISEQEATAPLFSVPILQDFIRFYNNNSHRVFGKYLEQAIQFFHQQKEFYKNQWKNYQKIFSEKPASKPRPANKKSRKKKHFQ